MTSQKLFFCKHSNALVLLCVTFEVMEGMWETKCADHVAALGAVGLVSNHNVCLRKMIATVLQQNQFCQ